MKKFYILLVISALFLITCKKLPKVKIYNLEISEESVTTTTSDATISAKYSFPTEIYEIKVLVNTTNNMDNASFTVATIENNLLSATIDNLLPSTNYYYCFRYSNGINLVDTDVRNFTTQEASLPSVSTNEVSDITMTSAMSGGNITSDGGTSITSRGVCWSTSSNPTISDSHTTDGSGTGSFTSSITGLNANTTYYIRAYATNSAGTAYGSQKIITTSSNVTIPTVTTSNVSNITSSTATCGGNVTSAGNGTIMARGVCWSTSSNPTISNSHTTDGTGTGNFTSSITGLISSTTYYVRAYATNSAGTAYGSQKTFTTSSNVTAPTGAINGLFSVSSTQQVYFSKGNLQYQASTHTWRFATNQYDMIGNSNSNISSTYNGWIDLFGWGTSGYNHGAVCYQPYAVSSTNTDFYAYGNAYNNLNNGTGEADWGYNAISNGGNTINEWRTMTNSEWQYVFEIRNTVSGIRYAKAKVNGISGIILLPDNWNSSIYSLNNVNTSSANYTSNVISISIWTNTLEANGAVFLPAAGSRYLASIDLVGVCGRYWSASYDDNNNAHALSISDLNLNPNYYFYRCYGLSVRLVRDY